MREHAIYDILETSTPCPYVIQSFLRTPEANFRPHLSGGTLDGRLRRSQNREVNTVTTVLRTEDRRLAERWTAELSAAVAWLESLDLAHGDLRPTNVLVDADDHLKLTDFGSAKPIGSVSYVRQCSPLGAPATRIATWGFWHLRAREGAVCDRVNGILYHPRFRAVWQSRAKPG